LVKIADDGTADSSTITDTTNAAIIYNSKVRRLSIPPRYISTFVNQFDANGNKINSKLSYDTSKSQGRCGTCRSFERATNFEVILSNLYLWSSVMAK
jgi:hypothetical protein